MMLVDDNKDIREMIKSILKDDVDEFYECSDGTEALQAYSQFQPNVVLMDIKLKKLDGLSATKQIKAKFPDAKIVIVTNYADSQMREAARLAGADTLISKENLLEVRQVL
jgi:CheY-like chemotaxis protein